MTRTRNSYTGLELKIFAILCLTLIGVSGTPARPHSAQERPGEPVAEQGEAEAHLRQAKALARSGNPSESAEQFHLLVLRFPQYRSDLMNVAQEIFYLGKEPDALGLLEQYLLRSPDDLEARRFYGDLLAFNGRHDAALLQFEKILQVAPDHLETLVSKAKVMSWRGDLEECLELFERALARQPDNERALVGYGFALKWSGNSLRAAEVLRQARELNPADREVEQALLSLESEEAAGQSESRAVPAGDQPEDPQNDQLSFLLASAQLAADRGEFEGAIQLYRQVLDLEPGNVAAKRQLARILSWSRRFEEALAIYAEVLAESPEDLSARQELARVKSWDGRYQESLDDYRKLLETLGEAERGGVRPSEVRLEMARVLSWDNQFNGALEQIQLVLDSKSEQDPERIAVMLERARILGYARRYTEALEQYEAVILLNSGDLQAKLGKAQVLYWSGQYLSARKELEEIASLDPNDETARLVLANVEYSLGRKGRALGLLESMSKDPRAQSLMESIRDQVRPVLRFSTGFDDSRETPDRGSATTLRVFRYTTSFSFSPTPDYRLELLNVTSQADTSNWVLSRFGADSLSAEFLARLSFRPMPSLSLSLGGGAGFSGRGEFCPAVAMEPCVSQPGRASLLYEIRPSYETGSLAITGSASRRLANYTPLATHDNVVDRREGVGLSFRLKREILLGADYWHSTLRIEEPPGTELSTSAQGGSVTLSYLLSWERAGLDLFARYEGFGYADSAAEVLDPSRPGSVGSAGVFMPRLFQRFGPGARFSWTPRATLLVEARGSVGPQRLQIFDFPPLVVAPDSECGLGFNLGGGPTLRKDSWEIFVNYDYYRSTTPSYPGALGDGSYQTHVFLGGFLKRF